MVKAVFIDWGFTFVKGYMDVKKKNEEINKILAPFDFDLKKYLSFWQPLYILRSSGNIENDEELEVLMRRVTQKELPVREIIELTIKEHLIPKEHIQVVKELKKDYRVALLSNNIQEWVEKSLSRHGIQDLFDEVIVSSEIGVRKPNGKIYYEALKCLSVEPEESVFVSDEIADDLIGASGLGIKTVWLDVEREGWWGEEETDILEFYQPDLTVKSFQELVAAVKKL